jgi:hypothetical protein
MFPIDSLVEAPSIRPNTSPIRTAMANIPTESRIFANRFLRDVRRLETLHAGKISPGATDWQEAIRDAYVRMGRAGKPDKQVAAR